MELKTSQIIMHLTKNAFFSFLLNIIVKNYRYLVFMISFDKILFYYPRLLFLHLNDLFMIASDNIDWIVTQYGYQYCIIH